MLVIVNGDETEINSDATIYSVLQQLCLTGAKLAIELNREIVPRSQHKNQLLVPGDKIEIVQAIGGG